jgi:hypothetical protein
MKIAIGISSVVFGFIALIALMMGATAISDRYSGRPGNTWVSNDPVSRIESGCQREFKYEGEIRINDCKLRLLMKFRLEQEQSRLDRAAR